MTTYEFLSWDELRSREGRDETEYDESYLYGVVPTVYEGIILSSEAYPAFVSSPLMMGSMVLAPYEQWKEGKLGWFRSIAVYCDTKPGLAPKNGFRLIYKRLMFDLGTTLIS